MKTFRPFFLTVSLLMISAVALAQPASHYFTQMPANLLPSISLEMRKDLIDFYQNGKTAVMPSGFGGQVVLKEMSDDYVCLQTSDRASLQIKVMRVNDSLRVIAVTHTVAAPLRDSRVQFYTTLWKPYAEMQMPSFQATDFLDMEKVKALGLTDKVADLNPRLFVSIKFQPEKKAFWAYSSIREDMSSNLVPVFTPVLKDSVEYVLQDNRFVVTK
jgi:hypothetical protein